MKVREPLWNRLARCVIWMLPAMAVLFARSSSAADPLEDAPTPQFEAMDWDSVFAAYDEGVKPPRPERVGIGYSKVEGIHVEAGVGLERRFHPWERIDLRSGYDLARERPTIRGQIRFALQPAALFLKGREPRHALELRGHDGARPFSDHDPYGNGVLTVVGGYDARHYLREQSGAAGVRIRRRKSLDLFLGAERIDQRPLLPREDRHLAGVDHWMKENPAADRLVANGLLVELERHPSDAEKVVLDGTYWTLAGLWRGGELLGGDREYGVARSRFYWRYTRFNEDVFSVVALAKSAFGDAPRQALAELGGDAALRGLVPGRFVGTNTAALRLQYERGRNLFRRVPFAKELRVHLMPFAELGAAWGSPPVRFPSHWKGPHRSDTHWDLGWNLRRSLEDLGVAAHADVRFVWPMGADTGPARITFSFSGDGRD